MRTVTVDTCALPADDLVSVTHSHDFEFAAVSVSERETAGTPFRAALTTLDLIHEKTIWGEATFGQLLAGPLLFYFWDETADISLKGQEGKNLAEILHIITNGAFPKDHRHLSPGQRRQLRDALIFLVHISHKRDIFVTEDKRAFIEHGRREKFESKYKTKIMTKQEFLALYEPLPTEPRPNKPLEPTR